jgi:hypothetical protein
MDCIFEQSTLCRKISGRSYKDRYFSFHVFHLFACRIGRIRYIFCPTPISRPSHSPVCGSLLLLAEACRFILCTWGLVRSNTFNESLGAPLSTYAMDTSTNKGDSQPADYRFQSPKNSQKKCKKLRKAGFFGSQCGAEHVKNQKGTKTPSITKPGARPELVERDRPW